MKECVHFNGVQNDECKANVNYRKLAGEPRAGCMTRIPCFNSKYNDETLNVACEKFSQITEEMRIKDKGKSDKSVKLTMQTIALIKDKHGEEKGILDTMECPKCKGKLGYSISGYNGHIHASCENKCICFMQ